MADRPIRSLGVAAPWRPAYFDSTDAEPADGECWVQTLYSGLSAGTELTYVKGTNPYLHARWDPELRVFRDDEPATTYPVRSMGYMEVGRVTQSRTPALSEGQLVAMAYGHRTGQRVDPARARVVPLPMDHDPMLGVLVAQMGPICANGLLHAGAEQLRPAPQELSAAVADRHVLVTGAGVVGLLTALFARYHGAAEVAVADPTPQRLASARALGLEPVDDAAGEAWLWCKDTWRHGPADRGADVVFQCRGRGSALRTALRALRPQGCVVDLAFYQDGAGEVRLGEEFHHNGLTIRCAQIARVPRGMERSWDRMRLARETVDLLQVYGPAVRAHLVTDVVPFGEAAEFLLALARRERQTLQAVFDLAGG